MFFESRGERLIVAEYSRLEYIRQRFQYHLSEFILNCMALDDFELIIPGDNQYVQTLNQEEYNCYCLNTKGYLLKHFSNLKTDFLLLSSLEDMKSYILDEVEYEDEETSICILKRLLINATVGLYRKRVDFIFNEIVLDEILDEINENIGDVEDVLLGKPVKTINYKKKQRTAVHKREQGEWRREQEDANEALSDMYALGAFADE